MHEAANDGFDVFEDVLEEEPQVEAEGEVVEEVGSLAHDEDDAGGDAEEFVVDGCPVLDGLEKGVEKKDESAEEVCDSDGKEDVAGLFARLGEDEEGDDYEERANHGDER